MKICPMLILARERNRLGQKPEGASGEILTGNLPRCIGEKCAWWHKWLGLDDMGSCALVAIARGLDTAN